MSEARQTCVPTRLHGSVSMLCCRCSTKLIPPTASEEACPTIMQGIGQGVRDSHTKGNGVAALKEAICHSCAAEDLRKCSGSQRMPLPRKFGWHTERG